MRSATMMYEKLDTMLEVIISQKKTREFKREARRIERLKGRERREKERR